MISLPLPQPLDGYVAERFLYDLDPTKTGWLKARAVAVAAYPGDAPTLVLLLTEPGPAQGSVFTYIPFDAFATQPGAALRPFASVVYHNCPEGPVDLGVIATLPGEVNAYLKGEDTWIGARYLATLDWFMGNNLLNLVLLETGQLAALPFHKLKFGAAAPQSFAPFRKIHATWRVG